MGRPKGSKNKPWADCHPSRKHYGRGMCRACWKADYRQQHPIQEAIYAARYNAKRQASGSWRGNVYKRNFGISLEDYEELLEKQGGVCAICKNKCPSGRRLAVDHDHVTKRVRGLLCCNCNRVLGWIEKKDWMKIAGSYIGRVVDE